MRTTIAILVAGLALAACSRGADSSQSEAAGAAFNSAFNDGFKQNFRRTGIDSCVRAADARVSAAGRAPSFSFRAACTCFIDRVMAGKTTAELMSLRPGAREQAVMEQCARELGAR